MLIFCKSTRKRSLPLNFLCTKTELAYFRSGSVVMMPHLCRKASYTMMFSFKLSGVSRFRLEDRLSSKGVNFTFKSLLIPMSNLCLANMSWFSTWDSWLSCGLSCSSFYKIINSGSMRFCIGVCWASSPGT